MAITSEYKAYLKSHKWKTKRLKVLNRAKFRCERCKKRQAREIHHLTYENIFNEPLEDLQALCTRCHRQAHGLSVKSVRRPFFKGLKQVLAKVIG